MGLKNLILLILFRGNFSLNYRNAIFQIFIYLGTPKTDYGPALRHQVIIDFNVALHISLDFISPKFLVGFETFFLVFPVFAVEEFAVNEYGNFEFFEGEVGCAKNFPVVFSIPVAKMPQCFCQTDFILGVGTTNGTHNFGALD